MKTILASVLVFGFMGGTAHACFPNCSEAQSRAMGMQSHSPYDQGHLQGAMQQQMRREHLIMRDDHRRTMQQLDHLNHTLRNSCGFGMRC